MAVDNLVIGALQYSPLLLAVEAETESRQQQIVVADSEFDCRSFIESRYDDNSDPVGNLLTTGGSPRFRDQIWSGSAGYRRKTRHGGEWELAQHLGFQDNNSRFFVPEEQGTTRLEISFTQPLLGRAGVAYNSSRTVLAQIDASVAQDELQDYLLSHLLKGKRGLLGTLPRQSDLSPEAEVAAERGIDSGVAGSPSARRRRAAADSPRQVRRCQPAFRDRAG